MVLSAFVSLVTSIAVWAQDPAAAPRLDNIDDIYELREVVESNEHSLRIAVDLGGGGSAALALQSFEHFAPNRRVLFDGKLLNPADYDTGSHYYRGGISGNSGSYALQAVEPASTGDGVN